MLAKILKSFPYAHDHHTLRTLEVDEIVEIDDGVFQGLHDEHYIGEPTPAEIEAAQSGPVVLAAPVEIPDDWADLQWFKLQKLATALNGGSKVANKVAAMAIVQAEVDARAVAAG